MNKTIYCFWFGDSMSPSRKECYESLVNDSGVDVCLITEKNLSDYNIGQNSIHEGFQYLSSTHKADYLRSYFMYHYGGGYSDVKRCSFEWNQYFEVLENSDKDFIGYPEMGPGDIAYIPACEHYNLLVGNGAYIFKSKTNFAKEWLSLTNEKLDIVLEELKKYPGTYHPRAVRGGIHELITNDSNYKYPLEWNELLGRIFHKLQFDNLDKFIIGLPRINMSNYR